MLIFKFNYQNQINKSIKFDKKKVKNIIKRVHYGQRGKKTQSKKHSIII